MLVLVVVDDALVGEEEEEPAPALPLPEEDDRRCFDDAEEEEEDNDDDGMDATDFASSIAVDPVVARRLRLLTLSDIVDLASRSVLLLLSDFDFCCFSFSVKKFDNELSTATIRLAYLPKLDDRRGRSCRPRVLSGIVNGSCLSLRSSSLVTSFEFAVVSFSCFGLPVVEILLVILLSCCFCCKSSFSLSLFLSNRFKISP